VLPKVAELTKNKIAQSGHPALALHNITLRYKYFSDSILSKIVLFQRELVVD
jgi:hypothetical protein